MSVLGLILSSYPYPRSAMVRFPFARRHKLCQSKTLLYFGKIKILTHAVGCKFISFCNVLFLNQIFGCNGIKLGGKFTYEEIRLIFG